MNAFIKAQKGIEKGVVSGYKKIEDGVVSGYKKIEDGVVAGYKKIEDKFVDAFLTPDTDSICEENKTDAYSQQKNNDRRVLPMNETTRNENNFIGYEYKDVTVRRESEALYTDSYGSFGWKLEGENPSLSVTSVNLKFKRDRRIPNKAELIRLQQEFDSHVKTIEKLEDSKNIAGGAAAYVIGLVGTALMAGATFSYLAGMIPLCVILAVPGFAAWGVSYLAYLRIKKGKTEKVAPMIDREYDAIYEVCEKANGLAHA